LEAAFGRSRPIFDRRMGEKEIPESTDLPVEIAVKEIACTAS
jgi:hypothetical protein